MRKFGRGKSGGRLLLTMTLLVIGIALVGATSGAVDMFLRIDEPTLAGESLVVGHEGSIEVDGFDFGVLNPGSGSLDKTASKPEF